MDLVLIKPYEKRKVQTVGPKGEVIEGYIVYFIYPGANGEGSESEFQVSEFIDSDGEGLDFMVESLNNAFRFGALEMLRIQNHVQREFLTINNFPITKL